MRTTLAINGLILEAKFEDIPLLGRLIPGYLLVHFPSQTPLDYIQKHYPLRLFHQDTTSL